jgi:hypothetical protein
MSLDPFRHLNKALLSNNISNRSSAVTVHCFFIRQQVEQQSGETA